MKCKVLIVAAALALSAHAFAQSVVGIASGPRTGTNFPMVEDVIKVCGQGNTRIYNIETEGSLANIFKITGDKNVQYGVVQEDALVYQQGLDPRMMSKIVQVFPFFTTEMHLIKRKGDNRINSVADLAGKRVVEGPEGSATWVTVQVIKGLTNISWNGSLDSQADGMAKVISGQADAEWIVAGAPVGVISKNLAEGKIELVPVSHPALNQFKYYSKSLLPAGREPYGLKQSLQTYKVNTVLATFAYKNQYQREISDLVSCISKNVEHMQTHTGFHPKWKTVDPLEIEAISWPAHPAAVAAIKRSVNRR